MSHKIIFRAIAHEVDIVVEADLRGNMSGFGRGRGRFDKSPNVSRPRVASKTVSRDATRCYYCKEPGHILRFCERREDDDNRLKRGSSNMMANIDSHFRDQMRDMKIMMTCTMQASRVFKQLEEFRVSTSCTPFESHKVKIYSSA